MRFVVDGISELTNGGTIMDPPQCYISSDAAADEHTQRLCNFISALGGNFTETDIVQKWAEAYVNEDKRFLG